MSNNLVTIHYKRNGDSRKFEGKAYQATMKGDTMELAVDFHSDFTQKLLSGQISMVSTGDVSQTFPFNKRKNASPIYHWQNVRYVDKMGERIVRVPDRKDEATALILSLGFKAKPEPKKQSKKTANE